MIDILIKEDIKARRIKDEDMMDIYFLANSKPVRNASFNSKEISIEEHKKWFQSKLQNNDFFFVLEREEGFIGYVRFENKQGEWIISIAIEENFKGHGIGSKAIYELSKYVKPKIKSCIFAYIKSENKASFKSFLKAGYKEVCASEVIKMIFD